MSANLVRSTGDLAAETAVEIAWAQWGALTTTAGGPADRPQVTSMVDPEALVLLSLAVSDRERRLPDLVAGFARAGSSLVSVQRLKSLAKNHPQGMREHVGLFGRYALDAGDRRWRKHAAGLEDTIGLTPRVKDFGPLSLTGAPALMLRLRAGIGVGAKADLLAFLLGRQGSASELKTIALAIGYSKRAVRTAIQEMTRARFVQQVGGQPASYRADPAAWEPLLSIRQPLASRATDTGLPPWKFWSVAFAFLTAVIDWEHRATEAGWSSYVASSRARDVMEIYHGRLRLIGVNGSSAADATGAAYLSAFADVVSRVRGWSRKSLVE